jgi:hypothetical protein
MQQEQAGASDVCVWNGTERQGCYSIVAANETI